MMWIKIDHRKIEVHLIQNLIIMTTVSVKIKSVKHHFASFLGLVGQKKFSKEFLGKINFFCGGFIF